MRLIFLIAAFCIPFFGELRAEAIEPIEVDAYELEAFESCKAKPELFSFVVEDFSPELSSDEDVIQTSEEEVVVDLKRNQTTGPLWIGLAPVLDPESGLTIIWTTELPRLEDEVRRARPPPYSALS